MQLTDTITTGFTYYGWNIDLRTIGPFVKHSKSRQIVLEQLCKAIKELNKIEDVHHVRLFESTFIPPLPGKPHFDVILLVDSKKSVHDEFQLLRNRHDIPNPTFVASAVNVARFGDTDASQGPVLLNHFIGTADPQTATLAWKTISQWYSSTLKVTNSTLLEFEPKTPFIVVNYAVIPSSVIRFMANQLLRPSFYSNVTKRLAKVGTRARPLFARRIM